MAESANIARHLPLMAARQPNTAAIKIARGRTDTGAIDYLTLSFAELDREVDTWVAKLSAKSVQRGDRVLVMVRQGLPLIAAAFALFKLGAVPVIIDPGMGRENFLKCVAHSKPRALLGIPAAQFVSYFKRAAFASVKIRVWASGQTTARLSAASPTQSSDSKSAIVASAATDLAAILFTSGSTGAPKGVCYEHGMFDAQVRLVRDTYGITPGEIDLPMLPIFALFGPALGMTTIVPELDPTKPASLDPEKIVRAIQQENVTNSFGSPTLWRKITSHCLANKITLPSLKRVLMAGAPVPPGLFADLQKILPNGTAHSPYGATESLPVASISAREVLDETAEATARGAGTCVGRAISGIEIKIIAISDEPIATLGDARELSPGEIGEIIVRGPSVTRAYDGLPAATAAAKILQRSASNSPLDGEAVAWHRLGDVGYLDAQHRLWFCGRKAERVETKRGPLYTEQVEPIYNAHPSVARSALVGVGHDGHRPAIVIEPVSPEVVATPSLRRKLVRELRALGAVYPHTDDIRLTYLHPRFPVDVRHNAKIHRLKLAEWATHENGYESDKREVSRDALKL
ncbi:fatty acid CoA ligase family protein [Oleiharenicola lentus]|uniref:fatty acid CoA ligase family protein n=1 Tax=Oleiharenicola lentus TaxID=2508720 RepID=UPI003F66F98C